MVVFTNFRGVVAAAAFIYHGLNFKLHSEATVEECVANFKTAIKDFHTKVTIEFFPDSNRLRTNYYDEDLKDYPKYFFKAWKFGLSEIMNFMTPEEADWNLRNICQQKLEEHKLSEQIANASLVIAAVIIACIILPKAFRFVKDKTAVQPEAADVKQVQPYKKRPLIQPSTVGGITPSATPPFEQPSSSLPPEKKLNEEELKQKLLQEQLERDWNRARNNAIKHK